jgi:hypothetical protein
MTNAYGLRVLYLVPDLSDPAVQKRVSMLEDGGAAVTLAGFRRTAEPLNTVAGRPVVDFGQTYNGGFAQRLWAVLREVAFLKKRRALFNSANLILARNLEMLAIGIRGCNLSKAKPVVVYECLDIHRLLLNKGLVGFLLRHLEGALGKHARALITSSPAFVERYFNRISRVRLPVRLIENKFYVPAADGFSIDRKIEFSRPPGPPWRIGWFGAIRCRESLSLLTKLVDRSDGKVEVVIRGHPAFDQFEDFDKSTARTPGLCFLGPYANPQDLAAIYRDVHFTWAIDKLEAGLNSSWLLPNRLYEGGYFASVPLAEKSVETGRFLERLGIGVTLEESLSDSLAAFFSTLTADRYRALEKAAVSIPEQTWRCDTRDCAALVQYLKSLT